MNIISNVVTHHLSFLVILILIFPFAFSESHDSKTKLNPDNLNATTEAVTETRTKFQNLNGRIIGGRDAKEGEAPYTLSLMRARNHICGATLVLSPSSDLQIVVTAAHCVCKKDTNTPIPEHEFSVRGGAVNRFAGQTRDIHKIVVHELFDGSFHNDLALVFLVGKFEISFKLRPTKLPDENTDDSEIKEMTVSGWGADHEGGEAVTTMKISTLPVISNAHCSELYVDRFPGRDVIDEQSICGGLEEGGEDSCQGDSGGPAVATGKNGDYLEAVVSWGLGCAQAGTPGVYMRVSKYVDWIAEKSKNYETNDFAKMPA